MGMHVCMGATLQCSFGAAPSNLVVLPVNAVVTSGVPAATIMDNKPIANILPFGTCNSMSNSDGGRGHRRRARRLHADALHSGNGRALGARLAHGAGRQHARPAGQLEARLQLGRRDPGRRAGQFTSMVP